MLTLFLFGSAHENSDSTDQKNTKLEKGSIFISEDASIYGKEIIYNANYTVVKKKKFKPNYKLSVNKDKPRKIKHTIPVVKKIHCKNTILYNYTELLTSVNQKAQCIRLMEQHELGLTAIYYTNIQLHSFRMVLLSIYNHILIEHDKNMIVNIRPPPTNDFVHKQTTKRRA